MKACRSGCRYRLLYSFLLLFCCQMIPASSGNAQAPVDLAAVRATCSGLREITMSGAGGTANYKDLELTVSSGNTLQIKDEGVLLKEVTDFSFQDYTKCVVELATILASVRDQSSIAPAIAVEKGRFSENTGEGLFVADVAIVKNEAPFFNIEDEFVATFSLGYYRCNESDVVMQKQKYIKIPSASPINSTVIVAWDIGETSKILSSLINSIRPQVNSLGFCIGESSVNVSLRLTYESQQGTQHKRNLHLTFPLSDSAWTGAIDVVDTNDSIWNRVRRLYTSEKKYAVMIDTSSLADDIVSELRYQISRSRPRPG